jgi:hypothetical protein
MVRTEGRKGRLWHLAEAYENAGENEGSRRHHGLTEVGDLRRIRGLRVEHRGRATVDTTHSD